jgi:hypothetical protein
MLFLALGPVVFRPRRLSLSRHANLTGRWLQLGFELCEGAPHGGSAGAVATPIEEAARFEPKEDPVEREEQHGDGTE